MLKKFAIMIVISCLALVLVGCGRTSQIENPFENAIQADLVSRYNLTFSAYIWNDFQPSIPHPPRSTHFVAMNAPQQFDLTRVQMSVQIVTSGQNITRTFTLREYGGGSPQGDFRSTEMFRLDSDENFTLHVSILVGGYTQTVTLHGKVFVTH